MNLPPARQIDPAAEYERLTGRPAEPDWLCGVVLAAPRYLNGWLRGSALALLHELDAALSKPAAALAKMAAQPVAGWARPALVWWAALRQRGLVWPEIEKSGRIPSAEDLLEILGDPPLQRTCALFGLARAMHVAGYVTGHGLAHDSFSTLLRDAVADAFTASGPGVDDPDSINLGAVVVMMDAARFAVENVRKAASQRAPKVGRHVDLVLHAFIRGVQFARESERVTGEELALLAAASGFEAIEVGCMAEATKRWSMRLSRLGRLGPVPAPPPGAPPLGKP